MTAPGKEGLTMKKSEIKKYGNLYIDLTEAIKNGDMAEVNAAIDEAQKGCTARTIDAKDMIREVKYLDSLPYAAGKMDGTTVTVHPGTQHFSGSYKGVPECTYYCLCNNKGHWILARVYRSYANRRPGYYREMYLPDEAKETILKNLDSKR